MSSHFSFVQAFLTSHSRDEKEPNSNLITPPGRVLRHRNFPNARGKESGTTVTTRPVNGLYARGYGILGIPISGVRVRRGCPTPHNQLRVALWSAADVQLLVARDVGKKPGYRHTGQDVDLVSLFAASIDNSDRSGPSWRGVSKERPIEVTLYLLRSIGTLPSRPRLVSAFNPHGARIGRLVIGHKSERVWLSYLRHSGHSGAWSSCRADLFRRYSILLDNAKPDGALAVASLHKMRHKDAALGPHSSQRSS